MAYILGIESSCDETSAAVVRAGEKVISNVVSSQVAVHQPYGGVVPELASREHLRNIVPVVHQALQQAGKRYEDVDAIAVTQGPGLAGALLVGVSFAKALGFVLQKPLIAVNHLEGHIHAVLLEHKQSQAGGDIQFPVLALVVSGGHTHLFLAEVSPPFAKEAQGGAPAGSWCYRNIGRTRDDAAGEAFDKVAKLLGLGYPGGPIIDRLAKHGDPHAVKFVSAAIKGKDRRVRDGLAEETTYDFSFSGIKTAMLRHVETHGLQASIEDRRRKLRDIAKATADDVRTTCDQATLDLIASFQRAVLEDLVAKTLAAARNHNVATLFITGGVAANSELRHTFEVAANEEGIAVFFPSRPLSTDNAAMIAAAAYPKFLAQDFAPADLSADAALQLR